MSGKPRQTKEERELTWFSVPLSCLLGNVIAGFVGDPVSVETTSGITNKNKFARTKRLILICSLEDIDRAVSIALLDGNEVIWRTRVTVYGITGSTDEDAENNKILLRIRLPMDDIYHVLGEGQFGDMLLMHSGTTDPLEVKPIYACGNKILGTEDAPAGHGMVFSWKATHTSTEGRFALQEWGLVLSHPCRVVAMSPPERIFCKEGCVPLVECLNVPCATVALAILEEIEQCCMLVKKDFPKEKPQAQPGVVIHGLEKYNPGVLSGASPADNAPSCPLEKEPFYEALLRSTSEGFSSTTVFGEPLVDVCARELARSGKDRNHAPGQAPQVAAPKLVYACCRDIITKRSDVNGIFRQNGNHGTVKVLRTVCDRGITLSNFGVVSDNFSTVAFLKNYLLSLPTPLIPWDVAQRVSILSMTPSGPVLPDAAKIQTVFSTLPPAHLATLRVILLALAAVIKKQDVNSMTPKNLSVCITPCLTFKTPKPEQTPEAMNGELQAMNSVISAMVPFIENAAMVYTYLSRL